MSHSFFDEVWAAAANFPEVRAEREALRDVVRGAGGREHAAAEAFLVASCVVRAPGAPEALERWCRRELDEVIHRHAPASAKDDVRQLVRERLFDVDVLRGFSGSGSLRGWARVVASRAAIDWVRSNTSRVPAESLSPELPAHADVELQLLRTKYRAVFARAVQTALGQLERRERSLLRQHYLDDLSIHALGELYGVHRASAARWVASARERLLQLTRAEIAREVKLAPQEVESLMRALGSDLHASLGPLHSVSSG
jgi:RNA polymerase sigma-70 factor (ECF subfamily)